MLLLLLTAVYILAPIVAGGCTTTPSEPCKTCQSLQFKDTCTLMCRCDEHCSSYGDCCPDAQVPSSPSISENVIYLINHMDCQSRYKELLPKAIGDAYYMVSSCPSNWTNDTEFANSISFNCSSSTFSEFPPVSDPTTGITYRNEFCAICHRLDTSSTLTWPTKLSCQSDFKAVMAETAEENITLDLIRSFCQFCSFDPPDNSSAVMNNLRWCVPIISSCKPYSIVSNLYNETEYETITDACVNGKYDPICEGPNATSIINYKAIYKNLECARCNLASISSLTCPNLRNTIDQTDKDLSCANLDTSDLKGSPPFSAILHARRDGVLSLFLDSKKFKLLTCDRHQFFDPIKGCRDTVCPEDSILQSTGTCVPIRAMIHLGKTDVSIEATNSSTKSTSDTANCTMIIMDPGEYKDSNSSTELLLRERHKNVSYDTKGQPMVCANFSRRENEMMARYPVGFTELAYIGASLSIIANALILITYSIFKELRTLPSKLLMNFAVAALFSDIFLILNGIISQGKPSVIEICSFVSIILHYSFLARFSWMNAIGLEYIKLFVNANKLQPINQQLSQNKHLIGYISFGWGVPLVITTVTVIVNYMIDGAVRYGTNEDGTHGLCWINERYGVIFAFVLPILFSMLFSIIIFVIVVVLICIASRRSITDLKQHRLVQIRVILCIFAVLGITWLFGFLALLSNLSWPWYMFIILNSNHSVVIAAAFLGTKKIFRLYCSVLKCKHRRPISTKIVKIEV